MLLPAQRRYNALPTTNVVASANGERMLNPYSNGDQIHQVSGGLERLQGRARGREALLRRLPRGAQASATPSCCSEVGEGNATSRATKSRLHPKGDSTNYTMGLWVPVAADTGPSDGDVDQQFMTARYCVTLTEAEYNRVVVYIRQLQAEHKTWHGTTYNCNSFGMDVAKFIGLDTPNANANLPKDLIEKLADLNKKRPRDTSAGLYSAAGGSQPVRR